MSFKTQLTQYLKNCHILVVQILFLYYLFEEKNISGRTYTSSGRPHAIATKSLTRSLRIRGFKICNTKKLISTDQPNLLLNDI